MTLSVWSTAQEMEITIWTWLLLFVGIGKPSYFSLVFIWNMEILAIASLWWEQACMNPTGTSKTLRLVDRNCLLFDPLEFDQQAPLQKEHIFVCVYACVYMCVCAQICPKSLCILSVTLPLHSQWKLFKDSHKVYIINFCNKMIGHGVEFMLMTREIYFTFKTLS